MEPGASNKVYLMAYVRQARRVVPRPPIKINKRQLRVYLFIITVRKEERTI